MKLRKILKEVVKEVAEEEGIPESEIWRILPRIKDKIR